LISALKAVSCAGYISDSRYLCHAESAPYLPATAKNATVELLQYVSISRKELKAGRILSPPKKD